MESMTTELEGIALGKLDPAARDLFKEVTRENISRVTLLHYSVK
jgi:hypothetical protein